MKNKISKLNKNLRYFLWTLFGIILISGIAFASTIISDISSGYLTGGNITINESGFYQSGISYWYNHTSTVYNLWNSIWSSTYNSTYASFVANNTFNQSLTDTLYSAIIWGYNHTFFANKTIWETYNLVWISTFNSTYHTWAYNQTIPSMAYTDTKTASQETIVLLAYAQGNHSLNKSSVPSYTYSVKIPAGNLTNNDTLYFIISPYPYPQGKTTTLKITIDDTYTNNTQTCNLAVDGGISPAGNIICRGYINTANMWNTSLVLYTLIGVDYSSSTDASGMRQRELSYQSPAKDWLTKDFYFRFNFTGGNDVVWQYYLYRIKDRTTMF